MNPYLIIRIDDNNKIIGFDKRATSGLAHQLALRITDSGIKVKLVDPEDAEDFMYLFNQVDQKRKLGFIEEYGFVPNGNRTKGEGARTIGRMIYPPLGGILEGLEGASDQGSQPESLKTPVSLLSSNESENHSEKIINLSKGFTLKIGGRQVN